MTHEDMWTHMDKQIIEKMYGGTAQNITAPYWPPNLQKLLYESQSHKNKLISIDEYNKKF